MKHLLAALAEHKVPLEAKENDLKLLLAQAQRFRGDSKSSETWEETLEKVLVELRASEYAVAFLKPVKKTEAWDYDKIILHPMDLQTMSRKIKSKSYLNKKAFSDDLTLIWDNCLTYNTDPNHHLRHAATRMRKKADTIMRRIPDRHERFAPNMIQQFKFTPLPSSVAPTPSESTSLVNGLGFDPKALSRPNGLPLPSSGAPSVDERMTNGEQAPGADKDGAASTSAGPSAEPSSSKPVAEVEAKPKMVIRVGSGVDAPLEDRPALIRTAEGMGAFVSLDAAMEEWLDQWAARFEAGEDDMQLSVENGQGPPLSAPPETGGGLEVALRPRSSSMLSSGTLPVLDVNTRLRQLGEEDDELAVWKIVFDDDAAVASGTSTPNLSTAGLENGVDTKDDAMRKRKRLEDLVLSRKRQRLEKLPEPERNPLENWWFAMGTTDLLANAVPPPIASAPILNQRLTSRRSERLASAMNSEDVQMSTTTPPPPPRKKAKRGASKNSLFKLMSDNVRTRKRARDIAIRIADQIEDEKQGVDPEDMVPLVPVDAATSHPPRKPWARRAGLSARRGLEIADEGIGPEEAQDCMESNALLVLEHANFDGSSSAALQVLADIGGRCIQNLGQALKVLNETHQGKMTAEEMVLHALFSNSIGNVHELETYIRGDVIKHGATLTKMLETLEEVANKREEPVDEDALFKDDSEVMTGLGDLGEDPYALHALGIDVEFGLRSLSVPKRLLRPRAKVESADDGVAVEVDKYPPPPAFAPLETKRMDEQIGLLRDYYSARVKALIPPPPPPPPPRVPTPPVIPVKPPTPPREPTPKTESPIPIIPPLPEEPPAPAPAFDPYNPSAMAIIVPKSATLPLPPPKAPSPKPNPEAPPTATTTLPSMHPILPNIDTSLQIPMDVTLEGPMYEPPAVLDDDTPDPSRVRVGPLGQIIQPSAATVAKQKRQHKAAQAKAAAAAAAAVTAIVVGTPVTPISAVLQSPVSATKPKKPSPKKPKPVPVAG